MIRRALFSLALGTLFVLGAAASASAATDPPEPSSIPSTPAAGDEPPASPISVSGSMSFASRYLFQGIDYSAGKPVLNPEADLSAGPLGAKLWVNHDLDLRVSNEFDFSLLHEWKAKKFSFATGYTYLWYPHREGWVPSQELYLEASRDGVLNPSLSVHYDFDAGTGSYSTFGLSHGFERKMGTITLGTNLFYQDHYYGLSGFPSSEWNAHFEKTLKGTTITPSVSRFVTWKNGDFRDANAVPSAWLFSFAVARDF
jgi:hypothetical protein